MLRPTRKGARHSFVVMALLLLAGALACAREPVQPGQSPAPHASQSAPTPVPTLSLHQGVGVVTKINPANPSVEINHEEIKDFMPPMKMEWFVKDASLLQSIQPGDKVQFTIESHGQTEMVSGLKKL